MYSSQDDIALSESTLIELTNDEDSAGSVDEDVLNEAIYRADRMINLYLRGRYITPFNPVPAEIRDISATLAKHNLYARRSMTPPEGVKTEYEEAKKMLVDLQKGMASLDQTGQTIDLDRTPGRIVSNRIGKAKTFSTSVLKRY